MSFENLGVQEWLAGNLRQVGIKVPTKIQEVAIPAGLEKSHMVGIAHTGSGKTAAFSVPII
jgi:ATP-dependent RNA helicase DeaD